MENQPNMTEILQAEESMENAGSEAGDSPSDLEAQRFEPSKIAGEILAQIEATRHSVVEQAREKLKPDAGNASELRKQINLTKTITDLRNNPEISSQLTWEAIGEIELLVAGQLGITREQIEEAKERMRSSELTEPKSQTLVAPNLDPSNPTKTTLVLGFPFDSRIEQFAAFKQGRAEPSVYLRIEADSQKI